MLSHVIYYVLKQLLQAEVILGDMRIQFNKNNGLFF